MSTSLLQKWCAARLSALCSVGESMAAQAESLMADGGSAHQSDVRLEAAIIFNVCFGHRQTFASLVRELSGSADEVDFTGKVTRRKSIVDLKPELTDQPLIRSLFGLCDLRASVAAAQFSCDELGGAIAALGLTTYSNDLYWMRDEWAAHNRRLEALVIAHRAQLVRPEDSFKRVSFAPTYPLSNPSVAVQIASFNVACSPPGSGCA